MGILELVPQRVVVGCMIMLTCMMGYMTRSNMSLNIIAMVEQQPSSKDIHINNYTSQDSNTSHSSNTSCHTFSYNSNDPRNNCTSEQDTFGLNNETYDLNQETNGLNQVTYDWNQEVQGMILGSYYWGYCVANFPAGLISERFGPTHTIGISMVLTGIVTLFFPLAASWHYGMVVALRVVIGVLGGMIYPSLQCLISKWAPPKEKSKFMVTTMAGTLGTVLTWIMLGHIIHHWGWNWAFYVPGIITLVWCGLWYLLITDTPDDHPRITEDEKLYIRDSIGTSVSKEKSFPPYKSMFFSIRVWAYILAQFGSAWGLFFLLNMGPKYIKEILGFDLKSSGTLASLPYLARFFMGVAFGILGDFIRSKGWMSVTFIRKFFIIFSAIIPGLLLIGQIYVGVNPELAVGLLTLSLGMNGACCLSSLQNCQDLAPNFAGSLSGISSFFATTAGFISPVIVGALTKYNNTKAEWNTIFIIGGVIYIVSGFIFMIFGTGEIQPWNTIEKDKKDDLNCVQNLAYEKNLEMAGNEAIFFRPVKA